MRRFGNKVMKWNKWIWRVGKIGGGGILMAPLFYDEEDK